MLIKTFVAAGLLALLAGGCSPGVSGSGKVISETRAVSGAEGVSLSGVGELTIVQGEPESLVIEAEDNILPLIETKTKDGILQIHEKRSISPTKPLRFQLTVSHLTKVFSAGAGSIRSDRLDSPGLVDIRVEGAGTVELSHLECATLKLVLSGAGDVKVQGRALDQEVELSGSANYKAGDFRTQTAKLTISGAGSAKVWTSRELGVEISGVGSVDYYGLPKVTKEITGVGSLHALGDKAAE